MSENITEQQQVEQLKKLWKENCGPIIIGVLIAVIIGFGWRYYHTYKTSKSSQASLIFQGMIAASMNDDSARAKLQAETLVKNFAGSSYASPAALLLAKQNVYEKNRDAAIKELQWVIKHSSVSVYKQVARIRLARTYIAQNEGEKALQVLLTVDDKAFSAQISEIKGDVYVQQNKFAVARKSYQKALEELPSEASVAKPILKMKIDDLPFEHSI